MAYYVPTYKIGNMFFTHRRFHLECASLKISLLKELACHKMDYLGNQISDVNNLLDKIVSIQATLKLFWSTFQLRLFATAGNSAYVGSKPARMRKEEGWAWG